MANRTGNYCAFYVAEPFNQYNLGANAAKDFCYYNLLKAWKTADSSFPFVDSHNKTYSVRAFFVPDAVIVGAFHYEFVSARRDIGIIGGTAVAYFIPVMVEAFQLVGILVLVVEDIIQCAIFDGDIGLIVFQYDFLLGGDVLFQDVAFIAGLYEAVVDMQFVEDDGRDIRIGDDVVGIEQCEAVVSGKEDAVAR